MKSIDCQVIQDMCTKSHRWCREAGFYDKEGDAPFPLLEISKAALIACEAAELIEALRKDPKAPCDKTSALTAEAEECADILLRLLDYCGWRGIDLGRAATIKHDVNVERAAKARAFGKHV